MLKSTGCGLPAGPFGLIGAAEGLSYLGVVATGALSLYEKLKTVSINHSRPTLYVSLSLFLSYYFSHFDVKWNKKVASFYKSFNLTLCILCIFLILLLHSFNHSLKLGNWVTKWSQRNTWFGRRIIYYRHHRRSYRFSVSGG